MFDSGVRHLAISNLSTDSGDIHSSGPHASLDSDFRRQRLFPSGSDLMVRLRLYLFNYSFDISTIFFRTSVSSSIHEIDRFARIAGSNNSERSRRLISNMGNCMTRLKKEMEAPPQSRRTPSVKTIPQDGSRREQKYSNSGAPLRRETASGIPGLTYDQAGRPVWRDPNLDWSKTKFEHEECHI